MVGFTPGGRGADATVVPHAARATNRSTPVTCDGVRDPFTGHFILQNAIQRETERYRIESAKLSSEELDRR
jgi:hypothetical protein